MRDVHTAISQSPRRCRELDHRWMCAAVQPDVVRVFARRGGTLRAWPVSVLAVRMPLP